MQLPRPRGKGEQIAGVDTHRLDPEILAMIHYSHISEVMVFAIENRSPDTWIPGVNGRMAQKYTETARWRLKIYSERISRCLQRG